MSRPVRRSRSKILSKSWRDFSRHIVTFRVTTCEKAKELQLPLNGTIRMRILGTEIAGLDAGAEMAAEHANDFRDLIDGFLQFAW